MPRFKVILAGRVASRFLGILCQLAIVTVCARDLGAHEFGRLGVAMAVTAFSIAFIGGGLQTYALRVTGYDGWSARFVSVVQMSVLSSVLAQLVALVVAAGALSVPFGYAAAGAVIVGFDFVSDTAVALLSGIHRQSLASVLFLAKRVSTLVVVALSLMSGISPMTVWAAFTALFSIGCVLGCLRDARPGVPFRRMVREVRQFWALSLMTSLSSLDVPVLYLTAAAPIPGYYAASSRIVGPLSVVPASLVSIAVPSLIRREEAKDTQRVVWFTTALYAAVVVLCGPAIAYIFIRILGPSFSGAFPVALGFVLAAGISGLSQAAQAELIAGGQASAAARVVGTFASLQLLGLGVLGIAGAHAAWIAVLLVAIQTAIFVCMYRARAGGLV